MNKLDKIRFHYYVNQDIIRESYPKCLSFGIEINKDEELTPIEIRVYETIKFYNLPLLPQFPVKNYFLDFGDPLKKIAIEVDSKAFHKDKKKDELRQKEIEKEGWYFYRIQGNKTYFPIHEYFEHVKGKKLEESYEDEINDFVNQHKYFNSDCLIRYLNEKYYKSEIQDEESIPNMKHISESLVESEKAMIQRTKRRIEWEEKFGKIDL